MAEETRTDSGAVDTATAGPSDTATDVESDPRLAADPPPLGDVAPSGDPAGDAADDSLIDGDPVEEAASLGSGVLFVLGLLWLAAMMWSVRASFAGAGPSVVISSAAVALPGVVAATLLAGAAAGLAGASRFAGPARSSARTVLRRLLVGAAAGAALGLVAAAVILFTLGPTAAIGVIAATVGLSALLAGAAAALPATPLAAGVAATLSVFISGALLNLFQSPLKSLLGAGRTVASQTVAADRFLLASALISGLVAGTTAYLFLRRREPGRRWPWFLLAGATPGLLSLAGEVITQVGGASLFSLVGGFSELDEAVLNYLGGARVVSGLAVAFAGGISAMILVGRTLRRPGHADDPTDSADRPRTADGPAADGAADDAADDGDDGSRKAW